MFTYLLLYIPIRLIGVLTMLFPVVTTLPFGIDTILVTGFANFLYVADLIPPLMLMYQAFIWVMLWKIALKLFTLLPWVGRLIN